MADKEYFEPKMDDTADNANKNKNLAEEKEEEAKERAERSVPEFKSYAVDKMIEKKDSDARDDKKVPVETKAKEGKDIAFGKITDTAKGAMDFFVGKKEHISGSPKEKYENPEHEARRKMQELKLEEEGYEDEERKRAEAIRETTQDRGIAGKRNIFDMMPNIKENIKSKFVMPSDIVVETREREHELDKVIDEVAVEESKQSTE